jgi:hypothetical protein
MSSYVVQASPFSKIFMPEWSERCMHDPTLIDKSEKGAFEVRIPRSAGGIVLKHLMPVHSATLIKRDQYDTFGKSLGVMRKTDDDEITPLVEWLTSDKSEETHVYGVVAIDIGNDFEEAMQQLVALTMEAAVGSETAEKRKLEISTKIQKSLTEQLQEARSKADARVKRALSITHGNLLRSWEALKSNGQGTYMPSVQEALGHLIIKSEVDRKLELNRKVYETVASSIPGASRG